MSTSSKSIFLERAASSEAILKRRMPGLFAPSNMPARPVRGPPKRNTKVAAEAAAEAKAALALAKEVIAANARVPWPSDVERENEPNDEDLTDERYGPELPTGDDAIEQLLRVDPAKKVVKQLVAVRSTIRAMRAAEPVDPNMARLSPQKRGAAIVAAVEAELESTTPLELAMPRAVDLMAELVEQEAAGRAKLDSYTVQAAEVESELERFKSEFVWSSSNPYVTQMEAALTDELPEEPAELPAGQEVELGAATVDDQTIDVPEVLCSTEHADELAEVEAVADEHEHGEEHDEQQHSREGPTAEVEEFAEYENRGAAAEPANASLAPEQFGGDEEGDPTALAREGSDVEGSDAAESDCEEEDFTAVDIMAAPSPSVREPRHAAKLYG